MDQFNQSPPSAAPSTALDPQAEDERVRRAFEAADAQLSVGGQQAGAERRAEKGILGKAGDLWKSVGAGVAKAGFETSDFLFGEPAEADKTGLRRGVEQLSRNLQQESGWNSLAMGTSQIVTGLIGASKIIAPIKAVQRFQQGSKVARTALEIGKGAAAGAVVLDPHEERLSDLIQQFPDLQNPVTEYLASDPTDSAAEGRFKNALEGIGSDLALVGAIKVIKYLRSGNVEAATKEISKLEAGQAAKTVETPTVTQESPLVSVEPQAAPPAPPTGEAAPGAPVSQAEASPQALPPVDPDRAAELHFEYEERAGILQNDGGFSQAEAQRLASAETGYTPPQSSPRVSPASLPEDGSSSPPRAATAIGEAPSVKEATPSPIRNGEITDAELATIMDGSATDAHAVRTYGSVTAARANGHSFTKTKLPWQKLYQQGGSARLIEGAARVLEARLDAKKGGAVLNDPRVRQLADDWAKVFNDDPADFLGTLSQAGDQAAKMVAQMEAGLRVGNKMFLDANELAARIRTGNLEEFGGNVDAANEALKAQLGLAFDTLASANSIRSNAGRALRRNRSEFAFSRRDLEKLRKMDPAQVTTILERAGGDLRKAAMIMNEKWAQRVFNGACPASALMGPNRLN